MCLAIGLNVPSYAWYVAVTLTTMTDLTAIFNTAALWAWVASIVLLHERATTPKVLAVVLSVGGVWIMSASSEQPAAAANTPAVSQWIGNLLALAGAMLYGLYEVLYKVYAVPVGAPSVRLVQVLTSMIGLSTLTGFWVFIPLLNYVGFESFEPPTLKQFGLILMMASLGVAYNCLMMLVIALTTPVFAAVGIMVKEFFFGGGEVGDRKPVTRPPTCGCLPLGHHPADDCNRKRHDRRLPDVELGSWVRRDHRSVPIKLYEQGVIHFWLACIDSTAPSSSISENTFFLLHRLNSDVLPEALVDLDALSVAPAPVGWAASPARGGEIRASPSPEPHTRNRFPVAIEAHQMQLGAALNEGRIVINKWRTTTAANGQSWPRGNVGILPGSTSCEGKMYLPKIREEKQENSKPPRFCVFPVQRF
ncbi:MAG: hypothetical protein BJ554DRAFT_5430 [Olpidium bornovanus]|uniref:EamA domain-containing protein n=1 Tax=Olpidium bornovanus TaxID=278681 RepID=A0A8H7ZZ87_9FUNG|nr:MAG: hypothetical protein BJ554DRAFT_5430 [Olpidium bornovanus]